MGDGLYYTLCNNLKEKPLTKRETALLEKVSDLQEKEALAVTSLIKSYVKFNEEGKMLCDIPYDGKQLDTGVKFDISNLPPKLGRIIIKFLKLVQTK